jgi:molybdopterin converting factor small subunit
MKSRRGFLRLAGSIAVGVGIFLISDGLVGTQLLKNGSENVQASFVPASDATNSRASLITVKAYYAMMSQYIDLSEENFVLQSPATLQDLMNTVVVRHPSMAQMMGTILMLLDGALSNPSASLRDGDTVQFIPLTAGG